MVGGERLWRRFWATAKASVTDSSNYDSSFCASFTAAPPTRQVNWAIIMCTSAFCIDRYPLGIQSLGRCSHQRTNLINPHRIDVPTPLGKNTRVQDRFILLRVSLHVSQPNVSLIPNVLIGTWFYFCRILLDPASNRYHEIWSEKDSSDKLAHPHFNMRIHWLK